MININNLASSSQDLVDLTEQELNDVNGGGALLGGAAGFASGFLGSLAGSASGAIDTGSFGYGNLRNAAASGLATGTVGALLGSATGAGLAGDD